MGGRDHGERRECRVLVWWSSDRAEQVALLLEWNWAEALIVASSVCRKQGECVGVACYAA